MICRPSLETPARPCLMRSVFFSQRQKFLPHPDKLNLISSSNILIYSPTLRTISSGPLTYLRQLISPTSKINLIHGTERLIIGLIFALTMTTPARAKMDSTLKEFFPLRLNDFLQYRDQKNTLGTGQVAIADTRIAHPKSHYRLST